jgi:DNA-binding ferritin-like protein
MTVITKPETPRAGDPQARTAQALADLASRAGGLRLKVRALRWQCAGPQRRNLEALLAEREGDLTRLEDTLAMRLRILGHSVPAGPAADGETGPAAPAERASADQQARLCALRDELQNLVAACRGTCALAAPAAPNTADRLAGHVRALEKGAWMLSAQAADG